MNSISVEQSSKTENEIAPFDLNVLKENPQIQQILLMALSNTNQQDQQNEQSEPAIDNDKRKFDQLNTQSISSVLSDHSSPGSDTNSDKMLGRPGRKPLTEEEIKKSDMDPKSKRKAQNRVAQRNFRNRRVNYVKELEDRIKTLEETERQQPADTKLMDENRELKRIIQQLQTENAILGGTASSFDVPLSKLTNMTNYGLATTAAASDGRPQKLLRSIGDDSTATLLSATTTTYSNNDESPSPDATISFAVHNHSMTDNGSSSSVSSKDRSLTPPDTGFGGDDSILFSAATPTDILNSFDSSHLMMNPFALDQDLFNSLTTTATDDTHTTKPAQLDLTPPASSISTDLAPKQQLSTRQSPPATVTTTEDTSFSDDLIESLLVIDDGHTASPEEVVDNTTNDNSANHAYNVDTSTLTQAWDKLTEHPRFDEFDIDLLCDEMKRKAICSSKQHEDRMKEAIDKYYPNGRTY